MIQNKSGVYLIKCPYDGVTMLKIGFSKDVPKRIRTHYTSNTLMEPLGYIATDMYKQLEKDLHHKCRSFKYKTEFFYFKEQIVEFFTSHKDFKTL